MSPTPTSPRPPPSARHAACSKVHKDSHSIQKKQASSSPPSSSSTNSSVSSSSNGSRAAAAPPPPRQKPQQPVIIYTHSPKVIRTNPRDFMSIVQKLTGLDPARAAARNNAGACSAATATAGAAAQDESSSSSPESCAHAHVAPPHPYAADPRLMPPPMDAQFLAAPDIPLFTPGPSELQLCVPQGLYEQFPPIDAAAQLGPPVTMSANTMNGGPVFSPSMVEAMRTFPDY